MHGTLSNLRSADRPRWLARAIGWLAAHRRWCAIVMLPTLLAAGYLFLVASDQYDSDAHFVVRTAEKPVASQTGLGAAFASMSGSGGGDAAIVADYLGSHDAVEALQRRIGLVDRFRRPGIDPFSRLWYADPTPETLLKYYRRMVKVNKTDDGVSTINVRSFTPQDSYTIANELLKLAEERVNLVNRRNYESSVAVAQRQLDIAQHDIADVQGRMTAFRQHQADFDPAKTGSARLALVGQLQGQLAEARAQADAMGAALSPSAPQVVAARRKVAALAQQVAIEQSRIASGPSNVATGLGTYEGLQARQELAVKQYDAAASALTMAQQEATKQQLFIVRVVDPNLPVKSLYPKRLTIVLTVFFALLIAYGIGWLIAAGVKEHAA